MTDYELITVNTQPGQPRRKKLHGRDYLVVNATILREGVLNGSRGPLYYPGEEIGANPGIWNYVPIVNWHPKDADGRPTLARSPDILNEYQIGLIFNDRFINEPVPTRQVEAWFDEVLTANFDKKLSEKHKVLPRLLAGQSVELSTGLFTDNQPAPEGATWNSRDGKVTKPYTHIARNYRPDHLASLPDQKGACSTQDGCGFNVNADGEDEDSMLKRIGESIINALKGQPRSANTGHFKPHGSGYGRDPEHAAAQHGAMVLVQDDHDDARSIMTELDLKGHNPISWVADEGIWEEAKKAARESGKYPENSDKFWAVVAHIYKQMGGKKKPKATTNEEEASTDNSNPEGCNQFTGPGCSTGEKTHVSQIASKLASHIASEHLHDPSDFRRAYSELDDSDKKLVVKELAGKGLIHPLDAKKRAALTATDVIKSAMSEYKKHKETHTFNPLNRHVPFTDSDAYKKMTANKENDMGTKAENVQYLVTNCDCWKGKEQLLNGASDAEVKAWREFHEKAKQNEVVANAVQESGLTINAEGKIDMGGMKKDMMKDMMDTCPKCGGKMMDGKCESCGYKEKKDMTGNVDLTDPKVKDQVCQSIFGMTANEAQLVMGSAKKIEQKERWNLVHKLTANLSDETVRKAKVAELLKQPIANLELLVSLIPETPAPTGNQQDEMTRYLQEFYGAGGGSREGSQGSPSFVGNRALIEDKPDVDDVPRMMPTINYDDVTNVGKKVRERRGETAATK